MAYYYKKGNFKNRGIEMNEISEVEKMLISDIREKKKASSGVHHRTGKRGHVGKMLTPVDFMSRKEKYNYRKGGKILSYNLYDQILEREQFEELPFEERKTALTKWYNERPLKDIREGFKCSQQTIYNWLDELGIEKKGRNWKGDRKKKTKKDSTNNTNTVTVVNNVPAPEKNNISLLTENRVLEQLLRENEVRGLNLSFTSRMTAEEIQQKLEKLSLSIDGEKSKFILNIQILET
jgi:hypothetical protein